MNQVADFKIQYDTIQKVHNPFFGEDIIFDHQGWNHLNKDGQGVNRINAEIISRLELLDFVTNLLTNMFPPTEFKYKEYSSHFWVKYFTFVYAVQTSNDEYRIKVVIRQKTNQPKHFYSVIKTKHTKFANKEVP